MSWRRVLFYLNFRTEVFDPMSEPLSKIPNGLRYYSGHEARLRRKIEETAMLVFDGWSYEEIITPTLDYYSLFERGMGPAEAHHAFRFTDTDGRLLALRPDVTSGIARVTATLFANRPRPLRLCYAAPVFRQQGQSNIEWRRELTQIGCELMGQNSTASDIEVLAIACEVLRGLQLDREYVITLNDVEVFNGVAEGLGFDANARDHLRQLVDGRNVADLESFLISHTSSAECRAFSQLIRLSGKLETLDRARRVITNVRSSAALDRLESLWRVIDSLGISDRFEIDLGDVSRLDYYTGLTFKIYIEGAGARVGSGGRYDNLTANFGKSEPAVGFVLDLDALAGLLLSRNSGVVPTTQPERRAQCIMNNDPTALFSEAIERRARGERVVIGSAEVTP
jgi:ATP phosphoribosyltransferase regulatory subunit